MVATSQQKLVDKATQGQLRPGEEVLKLRKTSKKEKIWLNYRQNVGHNYLLAGRINKSKMQMTKLWESCREPTE
jgi:hypothetical protein